MKALVYTGPRQIEYRDEPDPIAAADEIVVKVEAVGICGSDMHAYFGHDERRPAPLILGHEASGIALAGRYEGKRVVVNPLVSCNRCDDCLGGRANLCQTRQIISMPPRQGAFAEMVKIPEPNILPIPDDLAPSRAALVEPIATAMHGVCVAERALWRPLGEISALVIGGGAVGLSAALVLTSRGARNVTIADTNPGRRETAHNENLFTVVDSAVAGSVGDDAFGLVIDAVGGGATRKFASRVIRPGGVIVHIGLMDSEEGINIRKLTLQEVTFIGSYTYTMVDFRAAIVAIHGGALGDLGWCDVRPLSEGPQAFSDLEAGRVDQAKIILHPDGG